MDPISTMAQFTSRRIDQWAEKLFSWQTKTFYYFLMWCKLLGFWLQESKQNLPGQPPGPLSLLQVLPGTFDWAELQRCSGSRACGHFQLLTPPTWPSPPTRVSSRRRSTSAISQFPSRRSGHVSDHSPPSGAALLSHSISKVSKGTP